MRSSLTERNLILGTTRIVFLVQARYLQGCSSVEVRFVRRLWWMPWRFRDVSPKQARVAKIIELIKMTTQPPRTHLENERESAPGGRCAEMCPPLLFARSDTLELDLRVDASVSGAYHLSLRTISPNGWRKHTRHRVRFRDASG